MWGAIIGDIVGSRFEFQEKKEKKFAFFNRACHFTDDTVMTVAVARALALNVGHWYEPAFRGEVVRHMVAVGRRYPDVSWGCRFWKWLFGNPVPYHSFGNGAAMRISPVGWVADSEAEVRALSHTVTAVSHDHEEGLRGAEATAMAIYLARIGTPMDEIRRRMTEDYYPAIARMTVRSIRRDYGIDDFGNFISCQGSVPQALVCFFESDGFEDAVRNAVSLGGDTDTQGAITGSVAEAYYGLPDGMEEKAEHYLTDDLAAVCHAFRTIRRPRVLRPL